MDASPSAPDPASAIATAIALHQAGQLDIAAARYHDILARDPDHTDSLHLLGLIAHQSGDHVRAIELIGRAIALLPNAAPYHSNLGNALNAAGRTEEAIAAYRRAAALDPEFPDAHSNLGAILQSLGQIEEAIACYKTALAVKPDYKEALRNLASAFKAQDRLEEAAAILRKAIAAEPGHAPTHNDLGIVLHRLNRPAEAEASFRRALAEDSANASACNNLGVALKQQDRLGPAIACFRRAIALAPEDTEALNNLGAALVEAQLLVEAETCFRRAATVRADHADVRANLGMLLLARGKFAEGWDEYEWRWRQTNRPSFHGEFDVPLWQGEPAEGRTLFVHAEQGFGDTLQFCRYIPLLAMRGLRVIVEVQQPLHRLLRDLPGTVAVTARGATPPSFDLHCPMLSLPRALGTTLETIPATTAYLHADPGLAAAWRLRLDGLCRTGRRVGLAWAGNPRSREPRLSGMDRRRSLDPRCLGPLASVPGLHLISLQKGGPAAPAELRLTDWMDQTEDFADTAALIANLDLVISVDTAVAHLAAALGKPVWLLDRFDPCWRWLSGRRDSPWYPTLHIYRQHSPGAWQPVLRSVIDDLMRLQAGQSPS